MIKTFLDGILHNEKCEVLMGQKNLFEPAEL